MLKCSMHITKSACSSFFSILGVVLRSHPPLARFVVVWLCESFVISLLYHHNNLVRSQCQLFGSVGPGVAVAAYIFYHSKATSNSQFNRVIINTHTHTIVLLIVEPHVARDWVFPTIFSLHFAAPTYTHTPSPTTGVLNPHGYLLLLPLIFTLNVFVRPFCRSQNFGWMCQNKSHVHGRWFAFACSSITFVMNVFCSMFAVWIITSKWVNNRLLCYQCFVCVCVRSLTGIRHTRETSTKII